jgi:hypothetical protein
MPERIVLTHSTGGWVDPRTDLHGYEEENLCPYRGIEPRSSSLYPRHYAVSPFWVSVSLSRRWIHL